MQTDTDPTCELPGSGIIAKELTEEEIALYRSVAETLVEKKIALWRDSQEGEEFELQSFEEAEIVGSIKRTQIIFDLIEETAIWRKHGLPSSNSEESSDDSESTSESDQCTETGDE